MCYTQLLGLVESIPLTLQAESFKFDSSVLLPDHNNTCVDFGTLRVSDEATKEITIRNNGKYTSRYRFHFSGKSAKLFAEIFTITPMEGDIPSGQAVKVRTFPI